MNSPNVNNEKEYFTHFLERVDWKRDLAFFDNKEGKIIHVGIILEENHIIHG